MRMLTGALFASAFFSGANLLSQSAIHKPQETASFEQVVDRVKPLHAVIVLSAPDKKAMVAVSPDLQGRVLTSTSDGPAGRSFGWVNLPFIEERKMKEHFNPFGGEDRIWLGPEGGQYSIFFRPGAPFDMAHWYTPPAIDTEPFDVVNHSSSSVSFRKTFEVTNYSGSRFPVKIDRTVQLLSTEDVWAALKTPSEHGVRVVGFESQNKLTNVGSQPWTKETGLLSIWILGQYEASPDSTIVIPIRQGAETELGTKVTSNYFGTVPPDRLAVHDGVIYFRADAKYRAKVGINPLRAKGVIGSYDAKNHVLTIVQYTTHAGNLNYVNSLWEIQKKPFAGDVSNAYNDGPTAEGQPGLGHFYELESSSPAASLAPNESLQHVQRTIHLEGDETHLDRIARAVLGVSLVEIESGFSTSSADGME
ncbi:MAG TPA: DUF6786 family protein [Terracidiphilus sp.]